MSPSAALPPGPRQPRAWQIARYQREPLAYVEACAARHGPVFTLRMPLVGTFVAAVDPRDVQTILTRVHDRFPDGPSSSPIAPMMGESAMVFATGETHLRQRRTLQPAFRGGLAARWEEQMTAVVEAELGRLPVGEPVAVLPAARRIALEVICRLVFGPMEPAAFARLRDEVGRRDDPRLVLMLLAPTLWKRPGRLNPGGALKRRRDTVNRLLLEQIARRRAVAAEADGDAAAGRDDALSLLAAARDERGDPLGDAEIRDQLVGLVLVGHESSAAGLAWALERLSRSPEVRERLAAELEGDSGGEGARDAGSARGDGSSYLEATVQEMLRLRPPVLDAPRTTTRAIELGGHCIPPGTVVSAMCAVAQRRADVWEDPLAFRPERFLGDRPVPYAYTPFGGGVRRCIAASLTLLLMQVLVRTAVRRTTLTAADGPEERARLYGLSLLPSRGARVVLRAHSTRSSSTSGGRVASQLG
jgi:cytochrome P450